MSQNGNNYLDKIKPAKWYGSYVFKETSKYQKDYGFEMGTGKHATWNNEADAFKHTFMQAQLGLYFGQHAAKALGDKHERDGNKKMGQPKGEENMDKWNNAKGREIAREIINEYGPIATIPSEKINDIIAEKVMEKMRNGDLITDPSDKRRYQEGGSSTGGAAPAYTREQIGNMSSEEFAQHEKAIMEQWGKMGIPSESDLPKEKSKTSNASSGSSEGKWVTINGNHVLIKD